MRASGRNYDVNLQRRLQESAAGTLRPRVFCRRVCRGRIRRFSDKSDASISDRHEKLVPCKSKFKVWACIKTAASEMEMCIVARYGKVRRESSTCVTGTADEAPLFLPNECSDAPPLRPCACATLISPSLCSGPSSLSDVYHCKCHHLTGTT